MWQALFGENQQIKQLPILLHILWLLTILASVWINHTYSHREIEQIARAEAKTIYHRDMALRRWAALRGGVYVPISAQTPPNPYLARIPDRDIKKPDGTPLTLINPAYLVRLVAESSNNKDTAIVHMTSLKPLRPENSPDSWERAALERAELGAEEISEFTTIDGKPYLRYLHAVTTEAPCLKCHASQGYQLDDLRGGLAVAIPTGLLLSGHDQAMHALYLWHLLIYLLGATGLFWGQGLVTRRIRERNQVMAALEESEANFRTVADFAHAWEYWMGPDGRMKYISPSVQRVTGYPPQLFLDDPEFIKSIIVGDADKLLLNHLDNYLQHEFGEFDLQIRTAAGEIRWLHHTCRPIHDCNGVFLGRRASNYDITEEKTAKLHNEELIDKLREALDKVKTLRGFLPICAGCKKIRDDQGYWSQVESYIARHSEAVCSHGICPECAHRLYPDLCPPPDNDPDNGADTGSGGKAEKPE